MRVIIALLKALLEVEWAGQEPYDPPEPACPACNRYRAGYSIGFISPDKSQDYPRGTHEADCIIDAAFIAAGFPDQASRDKARERLVESNTR